MGRGLSELQQTILLMGLQGREARIEAQTIECPLVADVYHDDILAEYWLWEATPPPAQAHPAGGGDDGEFAAGRRFSRDAIGYYTYNNVHVVLSRAVARLVDRGLVTRVPRSGSNGVGVALTVPGVAAAHGLLERLAITCPCPARGGLGPGDLRAAGWRQFAAMLDRRHEEIRRDEEERRKFKEWVRQCEMERRRENEWRQEEARQAQERFRQQQERQWEDAMRRLRDSTLPRAGMPPPEVAVALGVLGLSYPCSATEIKAAYRLKALEAHSDHGGSDREFIAVKAAYDAVLKYAS